MGRILKQLSFILILVVLSSQTALAVSKSQSKYTGKQLIDQSNNVGQWMHWALKCGFGSKYRIGEDVGKLSWEDYTSFNSGWSQWNDRNAGQCSKDKNIAENILKNYLIDLQKAVNQKLGISTSTQTASSDSSNINTLLTWTDKSLCRQATMNGKWETRINFQVHVK